MWWRGVLVIAAHQGDHLVALDGQPTCADGEEWPAERE